jgi:hypothetical protein
MGVTDTAVRRVPGRITGRRGLSALAVALTLALPGYLVRAADVPATQPAGTPKPFQFKFHPNPKDAPATRVGGASRGGTLRNANEPPPVWVSVLTPQDRIGTTTKAQPVLYWYLSGDTKDKIAITLTTMVNGNRDRTIMDVTLGGRGKPPLHAGLQRLDLSTVNGVDGKPMRLDPNLQYDWVVAVEERRVGGSGNVTANSRIQRIEPPAGLGDVSGLPPEEATQRYAGAGVFLDTLATLNDLIDKSKPDKAIQDDLLAQRRELLKEQGLVESQPGKIDEPAKNDKAGAASR